MSPIQEAKPPVIPDRHPPIPLRQIIDIKDRRYQPEYKPMTPAQMSGIGTFPVPDNHIHFSGPAQPHHSLEHPVLFNRTPHKGKSHTVYEVERPQISPAVRSIDTAPHEIPLQKATIVHPPLQEAIQTLRSVDSHVAADVKYAAGKLVDTLRTTEGSTAFEGVVSRLTKGERDGLAKLEKPALAQVGLDGVFDHLRETSAKGTIKAMKDTAQKVVQVLQSDVTSRGKDAQQDAQRLLDDLHNTHPDTNTAEALAILAAILVAEGVSVKKLGFKNTVGLNLALSVAACAAVSNIVPTLDRTPGATHVTLVSPMPTLTIEAQTTPTNAYRLIGSGGPVTQEILSNMEGQDSTVASQIKWLADQWGPWYGSSDPSIRPMTTDEAKKDLVFYPWQDTHDNTHYKVAWNLPGYGGFILVPPAINWENLNPPVESTPNHEIGVGQGPVKISIECTEGSDLAKMGVPVGAQLVAEQGTGNWVMVYENSVFARVDARGVWELSGSLRPQGLQTVPDGYSAVYNTDSKTWGYGVGADAVVSIPDLTVDASGAHFSLGGTSIDIPPADISTRIQVGQTGALQIYGNDQYGFNGIRFAWNPDQNVWVNAADVRQEHREVITGYITVQTRAQLDALFELEPLVMSPFPKDTYFPPLDKIIVDYQSEADMNPADEFSNINPLGKISDLSKSPFRFVNYILLEKGEGRKYDTYIVTEQAYNPADGTFSLLHFGLDEFEPHLPKSLGRGLSTLFNDTDPGKIYLPTYKGSFRVFDPSQFCYTFCNQLAYYKAHNLIDNNAQMPEIKQWVDVWLTTGKVPSELETIVLIPDTFYIGQKQ